MGENERRQKKIVTASRAIANNSGGNRQLKKITDNRTTSLNIDIGFLGKEHPINSITQLKYKCCEDAMVNDLKSESKERFFTEETLNNIDDLKSTTCMSIPFIVKGYRSSISYKKLDGNEISNKSQKDAWFNDKGEHIYTWNDGKLIGGINMGGDNKTPHPTLHGGDPEVDYAGVVKVDKDSGHPDNNSGHFQPSQSEQMENDIKKHLESIV